MKHQLHSFNSRKIALAVFALAVLPAVFPGGCAAQGSSLIYPWWGPDESSYFTLPVGGWNVLGPSSVRGTAMGETLFGNTGPASGFFNPAALCRPETATFTLSYRYAHTVYKGNFPAPYVIPMMMPPYSDDVASFSRNTESLDRVGISLPFCGWSVAANYGLFQEFNIPDIRPESYGYWSEVTQSGKLRGANLSVSRSLTPSFSLGVSVSYLFGDLSRSQKVPWLYWILQGVVEGGGSLPPVSEWDRWIIDIYNIEKYSLDFDALAFNLGLTFRAGKDWTIGLLLRPPFKLNVDANVDVTYGDPAQPLAHSVDKYSLKQPFVAVTSVSFRPVSGFELAADLSYWGWGQSSAPYQQGWYYSPAFKSVLKLNLGAEYRIDLPAGRVKGLALRAGYIYDPQPYPYGESWARSCLTGGFGLSLGDFEIEAAAKIGFAASELGRFHSNIFQLGAGYRF
jgi:long-subunit fatty acid transport protein